MMYKTLHKDRTDVIFPHEHTVVSGNVPNSILDKVKLLSPR